MEITTYERQASVPNGESEPTVFDVAPDEARFSAGHVPAPRRGFGLDRQAHVTGAALVGGRTRPVYSVGTLGMVVHTEPGEDLEVYGGRVRPACPGGEGRVVWSTGEWDARCRLGAAWAVRPVSAAHQAPARLGAAEDRIREAA